MKKVLFIDDSDDNLNLYKIYFKKVEEVEVTFCDNPQEGLENAINNQFDIIFLDIQMPGMSGFEVLEKIKNEGVNSKIVALTGFSDVDTITKIEGSDFTSYLKKPILKKDLISFVDNG